MYDQRTQLLNQNARLKSEIEKAEKAVRGARELLAKNEMDLKRCFSPEKQQFSSSRIPEVRRQVIQCLSFTVKAKIEDIMDRMYDVPEYVVRNALAVLRQSGVVTYSRDGWSLNRG
jgi:hypothetical protein